jgi:hypothetical protein
MATWINELLPAHRHETDRAFEALEEMVMWATAAIARQHVAD